MPYTPNTGSSQSGMHYRPMGKQQKQIRALFPPDYPTMAPKLGAAIGAAAGGDQNNSHGFWKPTTPRAPSFFMKVLRHPWVSAIPYVLVTTGVVALEMVFIYMYGLPPWIAAISTVITVSMTIGVGLVLSWAAFKGNDTENAQIANIDALNGSVQRLLVLTLSSATTAGVTNPETAKKFAKIRRLMLAFLFGLKHEFRDNDHFQVSEAKTLNEEDKKQLVRMNPKIKQSALSPMTLIYIIEQELEDLREKKVLRQAGPSFATAIKAIDDSYGAVNLGRTIPPSPKLFDYLWMAIAVYFVTNAPTFWTAGEWFGLIAAFALAEIYWGAYKIGRDLLNVFNSVAANPHVKVNMSWFQYDAAMAIVALWDAVPAMKNVEGWGVIPTDKIRPTTKKQQPAVLPGPARATTTTAPRQPTAVSPV